MPAIVARVQNICQLVWLENLNLRGDYKARILGWIHDNRPDLNGLYGAIYRHGDRSYWEGLDAELRAYAGAEDLPYVRDDDTLHRPFDAPPAMVNFFYHEQIKRSAKAKR